MIWAHLYQLGKREGALLRVMTEPGEGYCDVHPWPELKDDPLEKQLDLLRMGVLTPLTKQSLSFADIDALGRQKKQHLLNGVSVPDSHFLLTELNEDSKSLVEQALSEGFQTFKVKLGKDLSQELFYLRPLLQKNGTKWRLDFNGALTLDKTSEFLSAKLNFAAIEFCEDPFSASPTDFPLPVAWDWEKPESYDYRIIKPSVDNWQALSESKPVIFTTYLGHPLGQVADAYAAARSHCQNVCGLLSHRVYPKSPFSEGLSWYGPKWKSPEGTGFGFDELFKDLKWERLI